MSVRKDSKFIGSASSPIGDWIKKLVPAAEPERDLLNRTLQELLGSSSSTDASSDGVSSEGVSSDQAQVVSLRRGIATVEVSSSCLMHELRTLRYEELVAAFRSALDAITVRRVTIRLASLPESR